MADVMVRVQGGVISVDKEKVQVLAGSEKVKWMGNSEFGIVLPRPYPSPTIRQQGGHWEGEGGPYEKINGNRNIKYDVTAPGLPTLDPDIELMP